MTQRMSYSPDPADQGAAVTVCYDTTGVTFPITVELIWDPSGQKTSHTIDQDDVDPEQPIICWSAGLVPADAHGGLLVDQSGYCDDLVLSVNP